MHVGEFAEAPGIIERMFRAFDRDHSGTINLQVRDACVGWRLGGAGPYVRRRAVSWAQEFTAGLASMVSSDSEHKDEVLQARLRLAFAVFDADDKCVAAHCLRFPEQRRSRCKLTRVAVATPLQRPHRHERVQGVHAWHVQASATRRASCTGTGPLEVRVQGGQACEPATLMCASSSG